MVHVSFLASLWIVSNEVRAVHSQSIPVRQSDRQRATDLDPAERIDEKRRYTCPRKNKSIVAYVDSDSGLSSSPRVKTQPTSSLSGSAAPAAIHRWSNRCVQSGDFRGANGLPHGIRDMEGNQQTEQTANHIYTP